MSVEPRLIALQTAVPPYVLNQAEVSERAASLFKKTRDIERLMPVFVNTGIDRRYSCVPIDWYADDHGWVDRTELYVSNAVDLLSEVAQKCADEAGLKLDELDGIVVSSTTGVATPSLDALVVEKLQLRRDIARLPIFGLGCAGGVIGLSRAAQMAKAMPGKNILFLCVELCALTFRKADISKSNIVATALFGDGAAGAILSTKGEGAQIGAMGEHTWPNSLDIMGWEIEEDGLKARFAQSIPTLVAADFRNILDQYLARNDLKLSDFDAFACHPGGAKVLDALEDALEIQRGDLADSRTVLQDFGNMSAVTVMFVLKRMMDSLPKQRTLATALGPGFSCAFLALNPA